MKKIDGKYEILKQLGQGFGGCVFLAESEGKQVALKQLQIQTELLTPEEILENFRREFSTLKELNHPHIVRILDFGFDSKQNFYYFTTEYIEGLDIFDATRNATFEEIEEYFVQILRALSYLHSHRVYHLDIKPANILIGKNEKGEKVSKLIDFGLARFQAKGHILGTPSYLPPEILLGESPDGRADLYSLGAMWYECLTGHNPFQAETQEKTINLQRVWTPPMVSTRSPKIPTHLDPILEKLLRKNPKERYHHPDQVIRDLNWIGSRHYPLETEATALAYLPGEGQLVGREKEWSQLLSYFNRVFVSKSDLRSCLMITGTSGTGKTRLLKELKYHAQLNTIPVIEVSQGLLPAITRDCVIILDDASEKDLSYVQKWMHQFHSHSSLILLAGSWLKDSTGFCHIIHLNNFDRAAVAQYVASVLGVTNPPDFLVTELYSRSEGNPLFLTELLRSLIQSHQIFDQQGKWSPALLNEVGIDFNKLQAPKTLEDYCRNKFEKLSPKAQKILIYASLVERGLDENLISKLEPDLDLSLWQILEKEQLVKLDPTGTVYLLNPNFRNWIPKNVNPQVLAQSHQALGDLLSQDPQRKEEALFHWGHGMKSDEERFQTLIRYGESLKSQHRWYEASKVFEEALEKAILPEDQVQVRLQESDAFFKIGQRTRALQMLKETQEILRKERDNPNQWRWVQRTLREMGSLSIKEGRLDLAHESLESSRVLLQQHEDNPSEMMILDNFKASLLMREGKINEAQAISEETLEEWRKMPVEEKAHVLNNELPSIYLARGKTEEARSLLKE